MMWISTASCGRANRVQMVHDKQVLAQMRSRAFQMAAVCTAIANVGPRLSYSNRRLTGFARHTQKPTPMYCSLLRVPASRAPTVVKSGCFGSARSNHTCSVAACSAASPLRPYCTVATASVTCGFTLPVGGYTGDETAVRLVKYAFAQLKSTIDTVNDSWTEITGECLKISTSAGPSTRQIQTR
jgi:hypothetical protein